MKGEQEREREKERKRERKRERERDREREREWLDYDCSIVNGGRDGERLTWKGTR